MLNRLSGLKVTFTPSAVVTEGQRVTLTCSTSCPLNTDYTWTFNSRPLNLPENQNNKQLVLDPLTSQHAGNYSCAVNSENNKMSPEATLTVLGGRFLFFFFHFHWKVLTTSSQAFCEDISATSHLLLMCPTTNRKLTVNGSD